MLVIFDYMEFPNGRLAQNLVAYNLHQEEIWRAENPDSDGADAYVNFITEDPLRVWNFASYVCTLDPATGKLVEKQFTK